ncbi:MAG TPA: branched-chain amino acid ABC transporter permease [Kiritimatiellia bacterium]|nr:branched-chain amino acid ABC transporter permease [Kiritimatiellia bacterium]HSA17505.1 branched-chain amino acid ABC transporter permease [Kiritimatiellia bacterium]
MDYLAHIGVLIAVYSILAVSLNMVAGYTGFLSLTHAGFYGIGAYVGALMSLHLHTPLLITLAVAVSLSGILGVLLALPALRLRDDHFVITTFAFQIILVSFLTNWTSITGGPMGLAGVPHASLFGWNLSTQTDYLIVTAAVAAFAWGISSRIEKSPLGRVLKSIREDDRLAASAGKNVALFKILIFAVSACVASTAGVLYVHYITFVDPSNFTVMESIFIVSIVILGGAGSLWGPVLGAVVLVTLPELLRFVGIPSAAAANIRQILYGLALVACMLWRPQGLIGEYAFGRAEKQK